MNDLGFEKPNDKPQKPNNIQISISNIQTFLCIIYSKVMSVGLVISFCYLFEIYFLMFVIYYNIFCLTNIGIEGVRISGKI